VRDVWNYGEADFQRKKYVYSNFPPLRLLPSQYECWFLVNTVSAGATYTSCSTRPREAYYALIAQYKQCLAPPANANNHHSGKCESTATCRLHLAPGLSSLSFASLPAPCLGSIFSAAHINKSSSTSALAALRLSLTPPPYPFPAATSSSLETICAYRTVWRGCVVSARVCIRLWRPSIFHTFLSFRLSAVSGLVSYPRARDMGRALPHFSSLVHAPRTSAAP
jgi:hypothetical protein